MTKSEVWIGIAIVATGVLVWCMGMGLSLPTWFLPLAATLVGIAVIVAAMVAMAAFWPLAALVGLGLFVHFGAVVTFWFGVAIIATFGAMVAIAAARQ